MMSLHFFAFRSPGDAERRAKTVRQPMLLAILLSVAAGSAPVFSAAEIPQPVWRTDATAATSETLDLIRLVPGGRATAVKLTGAAPAQYFDFGVRADEFVSQAVLELAFTPSPSLLPGTSQVNIYLNGELQGTHAIAKESLGKPTRASFPLNAKGVKPRNQLSIEFVGHYQIVCESESNSALWLDVSPSSRLVLTKQHLRRSNDLAQLPLPFVDPVYEGPTTLPIVFAGVPDQTAKQAAAIVAGYVGALTGWRGANFPVYFSEVPAQGHFIVFATNRSRPEFLSALPLFEGPELLMLDVPGSLHEKMLVIGGRDESDLVTAAQAMTVPSQMLIGPHHVVKEFRLADPLPAYASPNWLNTDYAVPFSQLMEYPEQLTARGTSLPALHLAMRFAPDIYLTSASRAAVNLLYRYTKPNYGQDAQLRFFVNGSLADSENLSGDAGRGSKLISLPFEEGPIAALGGKKAGLALQTDLSFEADYSSSASGGTPENCRAATLASHQIQIDASSMIEFDGLFHYARLPEIGLFTQGAFPFSKYADLSQTAAVISNSARPAEITTLLNAVGRIGAITGVAPVRLTVATAADQKAVAGKDLLIVGEMPSTVLDVSPESAAALAESLNGWFASGDAEGRAGCETPLSETKESEYLTTGFAAIVSVRSPLDKERTAVALLSEGVSGAHNLNARLARPGDLADASGGAVFISDDGLKGFAPAFTYTVGDMPWFRRLWLSLADRPFVLVLCALAAAVTAGAGIFLFMRRWIRRRAS